MIISKPNYAMCKTKLIHYALLLFGAIIFTGCESVSGDMESEPIWSPDELPPEVVDYIDSTYAGYRIDEVEREDYCDGSPVFKIELEKEEEEDIDLYFSLDGSLLFNGQEISAGELPARILQSLQGDTLTFIFERIERLELKSGVVQYRLLLALGSGDLLELILNADGSTYCRDEEVDVDEDDKEDDEEYCDELSSAGCLPEITAYFDDCDEVDICSAKELSNVVIDFAPRGFGEEDFRKDNLSGRYLELETNRTILGVWIKSGCNNTDDCPGCGEYQANPNAGDCDGDDDDGDDDDGDDDDGDDDDGDDDDGDDDDGDDDDGDDDDGDDDCDDLRTEGCVPDIYVDFDDCDEVDICSALEIEQVVLDFAPQGYGAEDEVRSFNNSSYLELESDDRALLGIWVRSGCNASDDCSACGAYFPNDELDDDCYDEDEDDEDLDCEDLMADGCVAQLLVEFDDCDEVEICSALQIDNLVLDFAPRGYGPEDELRDDINRNTVEVEVEGRRILGVWVKSGCNASDACDACGTYYTNTDIDDCDDDD